MGKALAWIKTTLRAQSALATVLTPANILAFVVALIIIAFVALPSQNTGLAFCTWLAWSAWVFIGCTRGIFINWRATITAENKSELGKIQNNADFHEWLAANKADSSLIDLATTPAMLATATPQDCYALARSYEQYTLWRISKWRILQTFATTAVVFAIIVWHFWQKVPGRKKR